MKLPGGSGWGVGAGSSFVSQEGFNHKCGQPELQAFYCLMLRQGHHILDMKRALSYYVILGLDL